MKKILPSWHPKFSDNRDKGKTASFDCCLHFISCQKREWSFTLKVWSRNVWMKWYWRNQENTKRTLMYLTQFQMSWSIKITSQYIYKGSINVLMKPYSMIFERSWKESGHREKMVSGGGYWLYFKREKELISRNPSLMNSTLILEKLWNKLLKRWFVNM